MTMTKNNVFLGFVALWAILFLASAIYPPTLPAEGDGFTRGLNRVMAFLGLQFAAGLLAIPIFAFRPRRAPLRRIGLLPITMAGVLIAALIAVVLWAQLIGG